MGIQPVLEPTEAGAASVRWIATCPDETKGVLAGELAALGVRGARPIYRGVAFEANLETGYRAHLWLRTASRIQRIVADLPADGAAALEAAAAAVPWPSWLLARYPFSVSAILTDDAARALGEPAVGAAIASGVARSFSAAGVPAPRFDAGGAGKVTLIAHLRAGVCTLGLDTAGRALHKRGWRLGGHPAVLKETLAASVLLLAGYDGSEPLLDPMCGSGTLVIEGAYIALHKAPLIHRGKDDFGIELQAGFDRTLWRRISDQARAAKLPAPAAPLFASDIRAEWVELARKTALRARVERHISFSVASLHGLRPPAPSGLLVANLPYGERIAQVPALYREVGRTLRQRFSAWRVALLAPAAAPAEALGLAPRREIPLMNGALPVRLLLFAP
ncbi:MAG TPA: RNA methyltransferase [Myxococcales bacterium]|nr:RNA methyltransferase [Myxococcales bacterium]